MAPFWVPSLRCPPTGVAAGGWLARLQVAALQTGVQSRVQSGACPCGARSRALRGRLSDPPAAPGYLSGVYSQGGCPSQPQPSLLCVAL